MKTVRSFIRHTFRDVRSSHRTKVLHEAVLNELIAQHPKLNKIEWVHEYRLKEDGYGGTFDIDIAGFDKGELVYALLIKAPNSNISKNIKNLANTTVGECGRLADAPNINLRRIWFVTIIPNNAPRFNNKKEVVGIDDVVKAKSKTNISKTIKRFGDNVESVEATFDIVGIADKKMVDDFYDIRIKNYKKPIFVGA